MRKLLFASLVIGATAFASMNVQADVSSNAYTINVVGYVNQFYEPGDHLFTPPLWVANNYSGPQHLSEIFGSVPEIADGISVSPWDADAEAYLPASVYSVSGGWTIDYNLSVGFGALLTSPVLYTNTFVGELDGRVSLADPPAPVPHEALGEGVFLLGSILPALAGFEEIIGRSPLDGEKITTLEKTYTYSSTNGWRDEEGTPASPEIKVAEAAFFTLVPEPSAMALLGLGATAFLFRQRKR